MAPSPSGEALIACTENPYDFQFALSQAGDRRIGEFTPGTPKV